MSIDWWTLAFQTINVLILVGLLARFFFRPVAGIVARRKAEIARSLDDARTAREEADRLRAEREARLATVGPERDRLFAAAEAEAEKHRRGLVAAAEAEVAKLREAGEADVARDRAAAERAVAGHASELAFAIARRLVERIPAEALTLAFLDGLVAQVAALPDDDRRRLAAEDVHLVSAAPLGDAEPAVRAALAGVLGDGVSVSVTIDPALIAGLEIQSSSLVVRNSWRADLERIQKEVSSERRHAA
ncbi:F0F1 ATP synthase subunit delta [Acuticoccus sediminis]|uniref:F0F1 ATP synthase subunit delta n=1 Tax=Acuticoccus sediminis TaxID=2184697 RepID=UPI001CFE2586|nr:F0F1 ATP synthase subunit delta [Acuticoccus sediminis]